MERTVVFPNPFEAMALGKKLNVVHLMQAAATSLGHTQPIVSPIDPTWDDVDDILKGKKHVVLKRENSDSSEHVIGEQSREVDTQAKFKKVMERANVWEECGLPTPLWMAQPFIPQLVHKGELRALVIGGVLFYTIYTMPDRDVWYAEVVRLYSPLSLLRYRYRLGSIAGKTYLSDIKIFTRFEDGPRSPNTDLSAAEQQFFHCMLDEDFPKYVLSMLGQIILAQEFQSGHFSGLRLFCRMDVSVYQSTDEKFHYFVNELDHSTHTGLWPNWDLHSVIETAWNELSGLLECAVLKRYLERGGLGKCPLPPSKM